VNFQLISLLRQKYLFKYPSIPHPRYSGQNFSCSLCSMIVGVGRERTLQAI